MNKYYIIYDEKANINYCYLLMFYSIAEYNQQEKRYNIIKYKSIKEITEKIYNKYNISISQKTIDRILSNQNYNKYITVDKKKKEIIINNDITNCKKWLVLSQFEVDIILNNDNLFCKYYLYLKYYCGFNKDKKHNSTYKQILEAIGYKYSPTQAERLKVYNNIIAFNGLLKISQYRDEKGHKRNSYSLNNFTKETI